MAPRPRSPLPATSTFSSLIASPNPNTQQQQRSSSANFDAPVSGPGTGTGAALGRSNTIASVLGTLSKGINRVAGAAGAGERTPSARQVRTRREADETEVEYSKACREVDAMRLRWEEMYALETRRMQAAERARLEVIKSALMSYQAAMALLAERLTQTSEREAELKDHFNPDSDVKVLIERYKTGPFAPKAHLFVDHYHGQYDVNFGIDLRQWLANSISDPTEESSKTTQVNPAASARGPAPNNKIPAVIEKLLTALREGYPKLEDDLERRRTWIYEGPLTEMHAIRQAINYAGDKFDLETIVTVDKYPKPMAALAGVVKLWLLELDPPLLLYSQYDDIKAVYRGNEADRIGALKKALEKTPRINLLVLDAVCKHFEELLKSTSNDKEDDATYLVKLGYSIGRCFVRPRPETSATVNDRFPMQFLTDLITKRQVILGPVLHAKTQTERERVAPKRKRTAPVDMRFVRSQMQATPTDQMPRGGMMLGRHASVKGPGPADANAAAAARAPHLSPTPPSHGHQRGPSTGRSSLTYISEGGAANASENSERQGSPRKREAEPGLPEGEAAVVETADDAEPVGLGVETASGAHAQDASTTKVEQPAEQAHAPVTSSSELEFKPPADDAELDFKPPQESSLEFRPPVDDEPTPSSLPVASRPRSASNVSTTSIPDDEASEFGHNLSRAGSGASGSLSRNRRMLKGPRPLGGSAATAAAASSHAPSASVSSTASASASASASGHGRNRESLEVPNAADYAPRRGRGSHGVAAGAFRPSASGGSASASKRRSFTRTISEPGSDEAE